MTDRRDWTPGERARGYPVKGTIATSTSASSDLVALLDQHRLMLCPPDAITESPPECACGWLPPGLNAAAAHRTHVADVIEAAGWRQVAHPDGEPLISEPDNHHNAAVCPYCSPGYLSPEAVVEREAAAWDAGHLTDEHGPGSCECPNPYRTAGR